MLELCDKGFILQNFFGFIDYKNSDISIDLYTKDKKTYHQKFNNYTLFLSHSLDKQSYSFDDKHILILFNGNISNSLYLHNKLNIQNSDLTIPELLKEAYLQWGMRLLEEIEGAFNLIIYDKENELLSLSKDKIGTIPLNFYHAKDLIVFGSRVSDFKEAPNFNPIISPEGLALYLQFGYIIQPNTIFKECYKVKSGESNNFDLRKKEQYSTSHWKLESEYKEEKLLPNEDKILTEAHHLLNDAINKVKTEHQQIAVSLSGGYDSSTIAALLQKESDHKVETFTIGFEDESINEAPHAKAIAAHLGTIHHEHYFKAKDALRVIPQLSKIYDEPFADHAASPTILTNEMLKEQGISNLFIGDGGDEVFATADDVHFFERIQSVPQELRAILTMPFKKINMDAIPYLNNTYNLPTKCDKLLQILSAKNIPAMTEARNILFREKELQALIIDYSQPNLTTFDEINFNGFNETLDEIIGTYFKTSMIDGELVKSYSASNHQNIQIHTPFLDEKLIAFMAKVPSSIKIKNGIKKYLLKEIAHQYIPKNLLDRPKSGFDIPFSSWMRHELKDLVYAQLNEERLNEDKLFYTSYIIKLRDEFYQGNNQYKYKLWRIFLFQLWYENFKG